MNPCIHAEDLSQLGASAVKGFHDRVNSLPNDLCAPFYEAARSLEIEILAFYKVAAICVKREEAIERVAFIWKTMAEICSDAERELKLLNTQHPACGADGFQDRLTHLKNKCLRLQEMHN